MKVHILKGNEAYEDDEWIVAVYRNLDEANKHKEAATRFFQERVRGKDNKPETNPYDREGRWWYNQNVEYHVETLDLYDKFGEWEPNEHICYK